MPRLYSDYGSIYGGSTSNTSTTISSAWHTTSTPETNMAVLAVKKKRTKPRTELEMYFRDFGPEDAVEYMRRQLHQHRFNDTRGATRRSEEHMNKREALAAAMRKVARTRDVSPLYGLDVKGISLSSFWDKLDELGFSRYVIQCGHCERLASSRNSQNSDEDVRIAVCCLSHYVISHTTGVLTRRSEAIRILVGAGQYDFVSSHWFDRYGVTHNGTPMTRQHYERMLAARESVVDRVRRTEREREARGEPRSSTYPTTHSPFSPMNAVAIGGYHSSKQHIHGLLDTAYAKHKLPLFVGIELEIEVAHPGMEPSHAARELKQLFNGNNGELHYCLIERDGSLNNGFEMVTAFTGLDLHEKVLRKLTTPEFTKIRDKFKLRSHDTSTCGLHVNIDRANISALHRAKMTAFANDRKNHRLMQSICRRGATRHAKWKPDDFTRLGSIVNQQAASNDRYEIINFNCNEHVIEFRGPRGTLRFESIMASMEFIRALWMFTRDISHAQLNSDAFIEFVQERMPSEEVRYLKQYLVERNWIQAESPKALPTNSPPRRMNLQEAHADALAMGFIAASIDL